MLWRHNCIKLGLNPGCYQLSCTPLMPLHVPPHAPTPVLIHPLIFSNRSENPSRLVWQNVDRSHRSQRSTFQDRRLMRGQIYMLTLVHSCSNRLACLVCTDLAPSLFTSLACHLFLVDSDRRTMSRYVTCIKPQTCAMPQIVCVLKNIAIPRGSHFFFIHLTFETVVC